MRVAQLVHRTDGRGDSDGVSMGSAVGVGKGNHEGSGFAIHASVRVGDGVVVVAKATQMVAATDITWILIIMGRRSKESLESRLVNINILAIFLKKSLWIPNT